eukprot:2542458-Prorocentrum_lima.AAC.1
MLGVYCCGSRGAVWRCDWVVVSSGASRWCAAGAVVASSTGAPECSGCQGGFIITGVDVDRCWGLH